MLRRYTVRTRTALVLASLFVTILFSAILVGTRSQLAEGAGAQSPSRTTVIYQPSDALFVNPERGFYHHTETHSDNYTPLDLNALQNYSEDERITLIVRVFYLEDFVTSSIDQGYLDAMEIDFATLRQAGLKAVIRFAYTDEPQFATGTSWPPIPDYGDASKQQIKDHIAQLQPILIRHKDVIAAVQAGFIGIWGEWYYTDHFVADPAAPGNVTSSDYANRAEVVAALLAALTVDRMVQVRTPLNKQGIYGTGSGASQSLPAAKAHDGSEIARTGHHNDCFLASADDFGTYADIPLDQAYLAQDTQFLPMGGETCNDTTDDDDATTPAVDESSDRSLCPTALEELARFHWSYLNIDYHRQNGVGILVPGVLDKWETGTSYGGVAYPACLDEVERRLGYRFALIEGRYPDTVAQGKTFDLQIDLKNDGWAAPFNPRPVELILRHQTSNAIRRIALSVDPRQWLAGNTTYTIDQSIPLPADLPLGDYDLLLALPDADPALASRPAYSIRMANSTVWEASTGFNDLLHAVRVESAPTQGNGYYVATNGDDGNDGSEVAPWGSIQKAADTLQPGDTVYVRGGIYSETVTLNVSGSDIGGYIHFRNYPGETPILDGTSSSVPEGDTGMFLIVDRSYLIIEGFEIRNYRTSTQNRVPVGINIRGAAHHIQVRDNRIHHIETAATPIGPDLLGADAHGIAVYGTEAPQSINHITIHGNEVHDLKLGSSEAVVLNGNVEVFTVTNNIIRDSDNIALDFIGFEETAPMPAFDQARAGLVSGNVIFNIDTLNNPSYGGDRSAGGIYVDGGRDILIGANLIYAANIGIEIASEHAGTATSYITVTNNVLHSNHIAGLSMGGYDRDRGSTEHCWIVNNTLHNNDTVEDGNGEILLQFDTRNNVVRNNIIHAANAQSLLIGNGYPENSGNIVDYNLYYTPAGIADSTWQWQGQEFQGFAAYKTGTGNDENSIFNEPLFVAPATVDLHLQSASPAVDVGTPQPQAGGLDHDGNPRVQGGTIDMGAYEYQPLIPPNPAFAVSKSLATTDPIGVGAPLTFTIRITNTGTVTLTALPLTDTYSTSFLEFTGASIDPMDPANDGSLTWPDLTQAGASGFGRDLEPGESFTVVLRFQSVQDTTDLLQSPCPQRPVPDSGATCNSAGVTGAFYDVDGPGGTPPAGPLPSQEAHADVAIRSSTNVSVSNYTVLAAQNGVALHWETMDESNVLGFQVWRTQAGQRRLLTTVTAGSSGSPTGASYDWTDEAVVGGRWYEYELILLGLDSTLLRTVHLGRIFIVDSSQLYMPAVTR